MTVRSMQASAAVRCGQTQKRVEPAARAGPDSRRLTPVCAVVQASEARVRTSTFWAASIANLGLEVKLPQEYPVVTVITKKGRRSIENAEQIAAHLRERFPEAEIALVDGNSLNTVPLKSRVRRR